MEFSLISIRRSIRALREAMESIAESYVLEPISSDIELDVEYKIRAFLEEHKELFDPFSKSPFEISVSKMKARDSDGIEISCRFKLSRCVQELRLSFGVAH